MALGDVINARLTARIDKSGLTLTVNYPPDRPIATGTAPGAEPTSPLTGPAPTQEIFPTAETPSQTSVTLKCLWLDLVGGVVAGLGKDRIAWESAGWMQDAEAVARVKVSDAALDVTDPYGDTVFTGATSVTFNLHEYRVLGVKPVGPSFCPPITYYVWLVGAAKQ